MLIGFIRFMLYLDDLAHTMPSALQGLQSLLFTLKEMEDPVFSHFLQNLAHMYKHWDFLPANGITCASFEFVNGCALESHPEFQNINSSVSSPSWSYYLRAKTGVAPAYAFMIFPAAEHPTLARYLPAIPDICLFIDLTNDVLSFVFHWIYTTTGKLITSSLDFTRRSLQERPLITSITELAQWESLLLTCS